MQIPGTPIGMIVGGGIWPGNAPTTTLNRTTSWTINPPSTVLGFPGSGGADFGGGLGGSAGPGPGGLLPPALIPPAKGPPPQPFT
jgi:hypothetical protein